MHDNVELFLIKQKVFARLALHEAQTMTSISWLHSSYAYHHHHQTILRHWREIEWLFFYINFNNKIRKCISCLEYLFNWHLLLYSQYVSVRPWLACCCVMLVFLFQCLNNICGWLQAYKIFYWFMACDSLSTKEVKCH